ncbi:MAG: hypothetical protein ACRCTJ_06955 [Brevinema sp.]
MSFFEATEENNNVYTALNIVGFLENKGFTKDETLIVIGGGFPKDLHALVGSCYKCEIKLDFLSNCFPYYI